MRRNLSELEEMNEGYRYGLRVVLKTLQRSLNEGLEPPEIGANAYYLGLKGIVDLFRHSEVRECSTGYPVRLVREESETPHLNVVVEEPDGTERIIANELDILQELHSWQYAVEKHHCYLYRFADGTEWKAEVLTRLEELEKPEMQVSA